jgi:hypothetical protein
MKNMQRVVLFLGLLVAGLTALAPSASAIDPRYVRFAGCPNLPNIQTCLRSDTPSGSFRLGNQSVPITEITTLSGGIPPFVVGDNPMFYNAFGGLTGNALEVPGGLVGLTGISEVIINLITFGANRVFARAELVGEPRINLATLDLKLPIRVNLINPFLRSGCGIGSAGSPINLNLTVGTTAPPPPARPISGHGPTRAGPDPRDPNILLIEDVKHVDNSFSVPGASGCDLLGFGLISGLINSRVGLPSAAGRNEAILDRTTIRGIAKTAVYP